MHSSDIVRIENLVHQKDTFYLEWRVTSLCNYQCDFCIQGDKKTHLKLAAGEKEEVRGAICEKIVSFLDNLQGYRTVEISLIGGEVTILKDFPDILERLAGSAFPGRIIFHITTNFSGKAGYYCSLYDIVRRCGSKSAPRILCIVASYYSAYTEWDVFERKLRAVKRHLRFRRIPDYAAAALRHGISLRRHYPEQWAYLAAGVPILSDEDFIRYEDWRRGLMGSGISIFAIYIRQYHTDISPENMKKLLRESAARRLRVTDIRGEETFLENIQALGMELEGTDRFCPYGFKCDAGMHSVWISALGETFRCPAIGSAMKIGDLQNGWNRLEEKRVCSSDHCSCNVFGVIEK